MTNARTATQVVTEWVEGRTRHGKVSRNMLAVGIVVLDRLLEECPVEEDALFSTGGELKGARSGLRSVLEKYGIPPGFLKEATGRQAAPDARVLAEALKYGKSLLRYSESERQEQLLQAIALLTTKAHEWLRRQPLKIDCDRHQSPSFWVQSILEKAKGRSGGVVEQHLVGAKLQERHKSIDVPNHPSHAADAQTKRAGDFPIGRISYHVTATDGKAAIERCCENLGAGYQPVLLLPRRFVEKAHVYAEIVSIENRVTILAIEDFLTQNIIEMSAERQLDFFDVLKAVVTEYNRRLEEVETDLSLKIELS